MIEYRRTNSPNYFSQPCICNTPFLCSDSHTHHTNSYSLTSSVLATSYKGHQKSQIQVTAGRFFISSQSYVHVGSSSSPDLSTALHSAVEPFASTTVAAPASAIPAFTRTGPPTANQIVYPSTKKGNQQNHYKKICYICHKAFSQHTKMHVHMHTHTGEKPFPCDICGKAFSQLTNMHAHMHTHTGEKPFPCDICGKAFLQSSALYVHMHIHTGKKSFHCDSCGKNFSQHYNLRVHVMRVHIMHAHKGKKPLHGDSAGCKKDSSAQKHAASKEPS